MVELDLQLSLQSARESNSDLPPADGAGPNSLQRKQRHQQLQPHPASAGATWPRNHSSYAWASPDLGRYRSRLNPMRNHDLVRDDQAYRRLVVDETEGKFPANQGRRMVSQI